MMEQALLQPIAGRVEFSLRQRHLPQIGADLRQDERILPIEIAA